jgi:hypothetical protein
MKDSKTKVLDAQSSLTTYSAIVGVASACLMSYSIYSVVASGKQGGKLSASNTDGEFTIDFEDLHIPGILGSLLWGLVLAKAK